MGEPGGLRRAAVRGAFASTLGQSLRIPIQLASIVVLARLLTPNDYGLVAMVTAVIGFADIVRDLGLSTAAVRTVDLTPAQRANLFWLNTGIGGLLTLLVMALAPVLASVYGRPEIVGITLLLAPGFLISGISTQYRVDLTRRLQFHRIALLDVISLAATVAGSIAMALLHYSYWALVIPQLIVGPLTVSALVRMNGWLPAWYDRSCDIRPFVRLGLAYLFGGLLAYASKSLDIMILGHRFGTEATGLYNRGTRLDLAGELRERTPRHVGDTERALAAGLGAARTVREVVPLLETHPAMRGERDLSQRLRYGVHAPTTLTGREPVVHLRSKDSRPRSPEVAGQRRPTSKPELVRIEGHDPVRSCTPGGLCQ